MHDIYCVAMEHRREPPRHAGSGTEKEAILWGRIGDVANYKCCESTLTVSSYVVFETEKRKFGLDRS